MEIVTEAYYIPFDIQGRGFNVQIFYLEEPVSNYVQSAVSTVLSIHEQVTSEIVYIIIDFPVTTYLHVIQELIGTFIADACIFQLYAINFKDKVQKVASKE